GIRRGPEGRGGLLQEIACLRVGLEEPFHPAAQLRGTLAGLVQEGGTLLGETLLQGGQEDVFNHGRGAHGFPLGTLACPSMRGFGARPLSRWEFFQPPGGSPGSLSSAYSQVRAYVQCRSAVASETPSTSAASGMVRPAKKRNLTSSA